MAAGLNRAGRSGYRYDRQREHRQRDTHATPRSARSVRAASSAAQRGQRRAASSTTSATGPVADLLRKPATRSGLDRTPAFRRRREREHRRQRFRKCGRGLLRCGSDRGTAGPGGHAAHLPDAAEREERARDAEGRKNRNHYRQPAELRPASGAASQLRPSPWRAVPPRASAQPLPRRKPRPTVPDPGSPHRTVRALQPCGRPGGRHPKTRRRRPSRSRLRRGRSSTRARRSPRSKRSCPPAARPQCPRSSFGTSSIPRRIR